MQPLSPSPTVASCQCLSVCRDARWVEVGSFSDAIWFRGPLDLRLSFPHIDPPLHHRPQAPCLA